ncbi:MAG TPA: adenosylmethionine decarboxylase [Gallionella sp.]|nr:adenosylmethionine decarboxylase [Gallionella sp.]
MKGSQIIADFHNCVCDTALLQEVTRLESACLGACKHAGLTVVTQAFHQFGDSEHPGGATGAVVLAESHLAVHSWPELRAVTLDIYVCNVSQDNGDRAKVLYDTLHMTFQPGQAKTQTLLRGDLNQPPDLVNAG